MRAAVEWPDIKCDVTTYNDAVNHGNTTCYTEPTSERTWVAFAQDFDGGGHFLLADAFVLLPLGGGFQALPGQGAQVEVHEDVAQRLQVVPPGLFCRRRGDQIRRAVGWRQGSVFAASSKKKKADLPMPRCVFIEA